MTDAHCHVSARDPSVREFLIGRDFFGIHPWNVDTHTPEKALAWLREELTAHPSAGVGEIGLDRLRARQISPRMRELFLCQLALAAELKRPVVLHGAKCWGEVVKACQPYAGEIPAFLFHGFSRSDGLIPDICALNGFISVGPAILNDHAVNYRALAQKIPIERLVLETDRTTEPTAETPTLAAILAQLAALRGLSSEALEHQTDKNAACFFVSPFDADKSRTDLV